MSRRKEDSIGPCVWNCPERSATCKVTCQRYAAHRQKSLEQYDKKLKIIDQNNAILDAQFNGLNKYVRRRHLKK